MTVANTFKAVLSLQYPNDKIEIILIQIFAIDESIDTDTNHLVFQGLNNSFLSLLNKFQKENHSHTFHNILVRYFN